MKTVELGINLDKLAESYGITYLDFAEIDFPRLVLRGRRKR